MTLPTPYYQSERVTLFHSDCLSILPHLSGVDAVVTDPPYGTRTNQRDEWMAGEFGNVMPMALPLIRKAMVSDGAFYCFTSWTHMADWLMRYQTYFKLQNIIVWDKQRHSGCWTANSWQFTWEGVFFGIKGSRKTREYFPDLLRSDEPNGELPMQKPVDVCGKLIRASTDSGNTILDPFMGSGTTGVAAVRLGRKFIGIEIDEGYCAIAARRIQEAEQAFALFEPVKPEQQAEMFGGSQ